MAAYAIGSMTIHNTDWLQEYGEKMPALMREYGGKVLTRAAARRLEGEATLPGLVVTVEFPTLEQAQAWYDDPAHAAIRKLRQGKADFDLLLVDGL
ncbi:DUF1330 domain-containing protein [Oxalobacteraceae bacterium]|nr:DUF1330 domain-containing protein [Oxalobacteraceae bacterium]